MESKKIDKIMEQPIITMPNQFCVMHYEDNNVIATTVDLKSDESIGVSFEKGYVIVRTQYETKFVCKGKDFICLWK